MKKIVLLLGCLLPLTILAACGGGGGSATTATATTAVAGPQVVYTTPLDGDTGVATTTSTGAPAPITVTFDRAMDPTTVTASDALVSAASGIGNHTFTVTYFDTVTSINGFNNYTTNTGNFVVRGTLTHDATNTVFTFTPSSPLTAFALDQTTGLTVPTHKPRTFKITIKGGTSGVKDANGNAMVPSGFTNVLDHVTTFTIWAGTQQSGTLNNDGVNGVGADGAGNIYMAGFTNGSLGATNADGSGQTSDILLTKYDPNGAQVWTLQQGSFANGFTTDDRALGLAVDSVSATPQLVVAGYTTGTLPMSAIANPDSSGTNPNYFIMTSDFDGTATNIRATQAGAGPGNSVVKSTARAVATDVNGNIYVTGETFGNLRSPVDPSGFTTTYQGGGTTSDVFLAKYDGNLNLKWTRVIGTSGNDVAYGVAVDSIGNVFITGQTAGSFPTFASHGGNDIFVAKFDTNGTQRWLSQAGTASDEIANAVTVDSTGNVYIAGGTFGGLSGANADTTATAGTTSDLFVSKIDNGTGVTLWTRQMGTIYNDMAFGVFADPTGNVYVTGYTSGSLDGNTGTGGADIFVVKYASNGTKLWTRQLGSPQSDVSKGVAAFVAPNLNPPQSGITTGYLYLAGYTFGNLDTNFNLDATFNTTDYFLAKYNAATGLKY